MKSKEKNTKKINACKIDAKKKERKKKRKKIAWKISEKKKFSIHCHPSILPSPLEVLIIRRGRKKGNRIYTSALVIFMTYCSQIRYLHLPSHPNVLEHENFLFTYS